MIGWTIFLDKFFCVIYIYIYIYILVQWAQNSLDHGPKRPKLAEIFLKTIFPKVSLKVVGHDSCYLVCTLLPYAS